MGTGVLRLRILLLLGSLASCYAWKVGQELEYSYSGRAFASFYEADRKYSIVEIKAKVTIQVVNEELLTMQLTRITALVDPAFNGSPYDGEYYDFHLPEDAQKLIIENGESLESPFLIKHKDGAIQEIHVSETDPVWAVNLKKAIASTLQLQLSSNYDDSPFIKEVLYRNEKEANIAIDARENSVLGNCTTSLRVTRVSGAEAATNKNYNVLRNYCARDSPFFDIGKQMDMDSCTNKPVFRIMMPGIGCKPGAASCGNMIEQAAGGRYYACKTTEGDWKVVRGDYYIDLLVAPLGVKSERFFANSFVSVILTSSSEIQGLISPPKNPVVHSSLAYVFSESFDEKGNRHQPGFEDVPPNRPAQISTAQETILKLLEGVVSSLDQNASEANLDYINTLIEIRRYLTMLTLNEIRDISAQIEESDKPAMYPLLIDVLATVGTPASAKYVADVLRNGKFGNIPKTVSAADIVAMLFTYVDYPTKELLKDLMDLVKELESGQTNENVHITSLMGMAELLYQACVSPKPEERFPTNAYGSFCTTDDETYKDFLAYVANLLNKATTQYERMAYITAAGTLGSKDVFSLLLPYIRGTTDQSPAVRSRAVFSLYRFGSIAPERVLPVLLSIYDNTADNPEVRMAALIVLLDIDPPYSVWQRMAWKTWFEPNKQVAAFTASLIKNTASLPDNHVEYSSIIKKAKAAQRITIHSKDPWFNSHATHYGEWSSEDDAGVLLHMPMIMSGYQRGPLHSIFGLETQLGPQTLMFFEFYQSGYGVQELFEKVRQAFRKPVKQSRSREINFALSDLDNLMAKLGVEKRSKEKINTFSHVTLLGRMHRIFNLDNIDKDLPKALKAIHEAISKEGGYNLKLQNFRSWTNTFISVPSIMGVPMTYEAVMPSLMSIDAMVKGEMNSPGDFDITLEGNTVISSSFVGKASTFFPFLSYRIAAGVERRTEIKLPRSFGFSVKMKDLDNIKSRISVTPSEEGKTLFLHKTVPFLLGDSTEDFNSLYGKAGFSIMRFAERTTKDLSPLPFLPILSTSEGSTEDDPNDYDSIKAIRLFYPESLRMNELRVNYVPEKGIPPQLGIGFEKASTVKYYARNFTYIESGTGQEAPRPMAIPVGQLDPEADGDIAGGYFSNTKLSFMVGENSASLSINYAQNSDETFEKVVMIFKVPIYTCCMTLRHEMPYLYRFQSVSSDVQSKMALSFEEGVDCLRKIAKGEISVSRTASYLANAKATTTAFASCEAHIAEGIFDSKDCTEARYQADTYDTLSIKIDGFSRNEIIKKFILDIKEIMETSPLTSRYRTQHKGQFSVQKVEDDGNLKVDVLSSSDGKKYTLVTRLNGAETTYRNIPTSFTNVLPIRMREDAEYPSCYVTKNRVETFDRVSYNYTIDSCDHLLAADCSGTAKFAVLASKEENGNFTLRIVTEADRFEISSNGVANVNRKKTVSLDETGLVMVSSGSVSAVLYRRRMGEYHFKSNVATIEVYFLGSTVTIKSSFDHSGRMCGLCGDMNFEQSLEFFDPKRCALSSGALMAASYRVGSRRCTPLSEEVQKTLDEQRTYCQPVDAIIRSALPIVHDNCQWKEGEYGEVTFQCENEESNKI